MINLTSHLLCPPHAADQIYAGECWCACDSLHPVGQLSPPLHSKQIHSILREWPVDWVSDPCMATEKRPHLAQCLTQSLWLQLDGGCVDWCQQTPPASATEHEWNNVSHWLSTSCFLIFASVLITAGANPILDILSLLALGFVLVAHHTQLFVYWAYLFNILQEFYFNHKNQRMHYIDQKLWCIQFLSIVQKKEVVYWSGFVVAWRWKSLLNWRMKSFYLIKMTV